MKKLLLLFHTIRFLKPIQFFWRLRLKLNQLFSFSVEIKEPVNCRDVKLISTVVKYSSFLDGQFCFLNESRSADLPIDWNNQQASKLWLYNLHYFDYLNQEDIDEPFALDLMIDWVNHNPVGTGNGWEPYTLSLRIVNWVKFLAGANVSQDQFNLLSQSLFLQARFLFKHLEYHLLGNHLFKNGVALVYAGAYFKGEEAKRWLQKGQYIIVQQAKEQVLADGGHFERSPMYHVLILEDILDCINLNLSVPCFSISDTDFMQKEVAKMLGFLADILHQDGDIPFFNDCALQIAPSPQSIFKYASNLQLGFSISTGNECVEKPDFGLLILQNQKGKMIFDVGAIGPDYLPGHAHCDSLSYELSLAGKRCIVNSGTFQYAGNERNRFRATEAHNTVKIDGVEQHEIWSTFRVARRGYPFDVFVSNNDDLIECAASLSGFLPDHPIHKRRVSWQKNQFIIKDEIDANGEHKAQSFIHLHPDVELLNVSVDSVTCKLENSVFSIHVLADEVINIEKYYFSPEFGIKIAGSVLVIGRSASAPFSFGYKVCF